MQKEYPPRQVYVFDKSLQETNSNLRKAWHRIVARPDGAVTGPLISCLMVTRGDVPLVRMAIAQFQRQTYGWRELVIVCDRASPELEALVREEGSEAVRLVAAAPGMPLGQLRNASLDAARGELICQWDDDDLYSAQRLEHGVGALMAAEADALFLRQWFIWCPSQRFLGLSRGRVWEGSMIAFKRALAPYPSLGRAEDTAMVDSILRDRVVALLDDPLSYCYCIHGANTFTGAHMQRIIDHARLRFGYERGIAEFSHVLRFDEHPAASAEAGAGRSGRKHEARRLERHLRANQFIRRVKRTFS